MTKRRLLLLSFLTLLSLFQFSTARAGDGSIVYSGVNGISTWSQKKIRTVSTGWN